MGRVSSICQWISACNTGLGAAVLTALAALPGQAAERVVLEYGPFSRAVAVASLQDFAETGTVAPDLRAYLGALTPEQQAELRQALTIERQVDVVRISQWFYTPMGEQSLAFVGNWVRMDSRLNGQQAIRAAVIASAAEDGTLSLIDYLRLYPSPSLRVNLNAALAYQRQVVQRADTTLALVEAVAQQSKVAAAQHPFDPATQPNLVEPGPYAVERVDLVVQAGDRTFPADLFLPQSSRAQPGSVPVVVLSHGLGDTRLSFRDVGEHLASHGFAVALPEHVGSNRAQRDDMFAGLEQETFEAAEFLHRPLDMTALLDTLAAQNTRQFQGQLDVERVMAVGHSFGGYAALALAGATIDFFRLEKRCNAPINVVANAAQLLECRALELQQDPAALAQLQQGVGDDRVVITMAFAPVSNLFGPSGMARITTPVMIYGGAFDIAAPVVPQQAVAFDWLQTADKYFYLAENTSHSAGTTRLVANMFNLDQDFEQSVDEGLDLLRGVNRSLVVAFAQVYLAENAAFEPFLTAGYVEAVSDVPFTLNLVRELPPLP